MAKSNALEKMREIAKSTLSETERHLGALGDFKDTIYHSQVLCMTYIQPEKTAGGIYLSDQTIQEDRFQGKIALVVAMGPGAFEDDKIAQFHGQKPKVGDWVLVRPSDGMEIFFNGNTLRLFQDVDIRMQVTDPRDYW